MNENYRSITLAVLASFFFTNSAAATDSIRVERYSTESAAPLPAQLDLLSAIIEVQFPPHITTLGEAIDYALLRSGYTRVQSAGDEDVMALMLPQVHRSFGPLELRTTIQTIAGNTLTLREDPHQRKIWFENVASVAETSDNVLSESALPPTPPQIWQLQSSLTLKSNLKAWAKRAGWSLEWNSRHDYEITHLAAYEGTFTEAVTAALEHYRHAPVPLVASFYGGNSVLLIESATTRR